MSPCSSDITRVRMFFTVMGALRENAMDDAASPTSSPSDSVSQTYSYKQQRNILLMGSKSRDVREEGRTCDTPEEGFNIVY